MGNCQIEILQKFQFDRLVAYTDGFARLASLSENLTSDGFRVQNESKHQNPTRRSL